MIGLKRDIIYDLDGSLSYSFDHNSTRTSATIVHGFPHIIVNNSNICPSPLDPTGWDSAVMCDNTVSLRRVGFTNLQNWQDFQSQNLKAVELRNITDTVSQNLTSNLYTSISTRIPTTSMEAKLEFTYTWAMPYITGRIYNVWWGSGIDFIHLAAFTTPSYLLSEKGIIFKFNYSDNREYYNIGPIVGGVPLVKVNYIN
jgi:hypothetical protein